MQLQFIPQKIFEIRGQTVMLDFDLAALYEMETKVFNHAVRRNIQSFPQDFMFRLSRKEWGSMRSQIVTSYTQSNDNQATNTSQIVMSSQKKRRKDSLPYAFTSTALPCLQVF